MIRCLADNYVCKPRQNETLVFDQVFESNMFLIILAAFSDLLLPDSKAFRIPLAIRIQNSNQDIVVDEKLCVSGNAQYEYFIPKEHYVKWKYSYLLVSWLMTAFMIISTGVLLYIYTIKSNFNIGVGLIALALLVVSILMTVRVLKYRKNVHKYPIK